MRSVLDQTFKEFECIVVDNCSTDGTRDVCLEYAGRDERVRYVRQPSFVSVFSNFNECFRLSSGKYFCWLGDDDIWTPEFLARGVEVLEADEGVVLVAPWFRYHTDDGSAVALQDWPDLSRMPVLERARFVLTRMDKGAPIYGLIRSDALRAAGMFREMGGPLGGPEKLLLLELALQGGFRFIHEVMYHKFYERGRNLVWQHAPARETGYYWRVSRFGMNGDVLLRALTYLRAVMRIRALSVAVRLSVARMVLDHYLVASRWPARVARDVALFFPRRVRNVARAYAAARHRHAR
jgi:glycosyltransferase involved in cell wall biosynthesis